jgi:hypothetical protein
MPLLCTSVLTHIPSHAFSKSYTPISSVLVKQYFSIATKDWFRFILCFARCLLHPELARWLINSLFQSLLPLVGFSRNIFHCSSVFLPPYKLVFWSVWN